MTALTARTCLSCLVEVCLDASAILASFLPVRKILSEDEVYRVLYLFLENLTLSSFEEKTVHIRRVVHNSWRFEVLTCFFIPGKVGLGENTLRNVACGHK